jgi:hypothetical protein
MNEDAVEEERGERRERATVFEATVQVGEEVFVSR